MRSLGRDKKIRETLSRFKSSFGKVRNGWRADNIDVKISFTRKLKIPEYFLQKRYLLLTFMPNDKHSVKNLACSADFFSPCKWGFSYLNSEGKLYCLLISGKHPEWREWSVLIAVIYLLRFSESDACTCIFILPWLVFQKMFQKDFCYLPKMSADVLTTFEHFWSYLKGNNNLYFSVLWYC